MVADLVEVDVHALKLEIRSTVVAVGSQRAVMVLVDAQVGATYTPAPSRPCSPEMVCQKAAPTWLPCSHVSDASFLVSIEAHFR